MEVFKIRRHGASHPSREDNSYGAHKEHGQAVAGSDRTCAEDQGAWPLNGPSLEEISLADARFGVERFDVMTVWSVMSQAEREALGRAAIAWAASWFGVEVARDEREKRAMLAAGNCAESEIEVLTDRLLRKDRIPGVPALLGKVYRACGDSDYDVGDGDVGEWSDWAEENLCTRCARGEQGNEAGPGSTPAAALIPFGGSGTSEST